MILPVKIINILGALETKEGIAPLVSNFYKIALGLAGASALGVLIYGSILWTLSGAVTPSKTRWNGFPAPYGAWRYYWALI